MLIGASDNLGLELHESLFDDFVRVFLSGCSASRWVRKLDISRCCYLLGIAGRRHKEVALPHEELIAASAARVSPEVTEFEVGWIWRKV